MLSRKKSVTVGSLLMIVLLAVFTGQDVLSAIVNAVGAITPAV